MRYLSFLFLSSSSPPPPPPSCVIFFLLLFFLLSASPWIIQLIIGWEIKIKLWGAPEWWFGEGELKKLKWTKPVMDNFCNKYYYYIVFKKVGWLGYIWVFSLERIHWKIIHTKVEDAKRRNRMKRNHKVEKCHTDSSQNTMESVIFFNHHQ